MALDYIGYFGMHVACLGVFWTGVAWSDVTLCLVLYFLRMFGLMAGYHRYFSHRSFKTSRGLQFLLGLLGTLGYQKGPLWWASHHRYHHRYSDTHLDYHSPIQRSFFYSHSGWFLNCDNRKTKFDRVGDLVRYPELVWLDNWNLLPVLLLAGSLWFFFGWHGVVWGFCINTILIWHAIHAIGSFGHKFGGYRRFMTTDNSRNKWFLAIALLGEGWHNNHHFFPSSARQGFVWWEVDVAFYILKAMNWIGLIWDLRTPSKKLITENSGSSQSRSRSLEVWMLQLRLGISDRVEQAFQPGESREEFSVQLLKQSLEIQLDDFSDDVLEALHHSPERLRATFASLHTNLANEVRACSDQLITPKFEQLQVSIDEEIRRRVAVCPIKHFVLKQNEASS